MYPITSSGELLRISLANLTLTYLSTYLSIHLSNEMRFRYNHLMHSRCERGVLAFFRSISGRGILIYL